MLVRLKSYSTLSEAIEDQAYLNSNGIEACIENSQDIHPTLLGQVFLSVASEHLDQSAKLLLVKTASEDESPKD